MTEVIIDKDLSIYTMLGGGSPNRPVTYTATCVVKADKHVVLKVLGCPPDYHEVVAELYAIPGVMCVLWGEGADVPELLVTWGTTRYLTTYELRREPVNFAVYNDDGSTTWEDRLKWVVRDRNAGGVDVSIYPQLACERAEVVLLCALEAMAMRVPQWGPTPEEQQAAAKLRETFAAAKKMARVRKVSPDKIWLEKNMSPVSSLLEKSLREQEEARHGDV